MNYILPILSVVLGFAFIRFIPLKNKKNLKLLLAFSGAFLLALTILKMLPVLYGHHHGNIGIFIIAGILLQIVLEYFSKGAEHGHIHMHKQHKNFPWTLFISLSIHSFLEGFPMHDHQHMVYGIVIHKLPIAMFLSAFFLESGYSNKVILLFLGLFAMMTPLGAYCHEVLALDAHIFQNINAVVVGILLHVSTTILFESSENHSFNVGKLAVIVAGILTAYFV
ncbi:MAG: ZIP family metal transporter [Flavobacteriaceae bacterium]|nr:ZIP family metal transporter [Flavobacteriaceae bacterium]